MTVWTNSVAELRLMPSGVLGRKIAGKSQRELHDLGLAVDKPAPGPGR